MNDRFLTRRQFASIAAATACSASMPRELRAEAPYTVKFLQGSFDGKAHGGGLQVTMAPGWKTYWRVPGAGGIPPQMEAAGDNVAALRLQCPLPARQTGEEGESIGYKDEVLFPFWIDPVNAAAPVRVNLSAFLGICETICIPVAASETWTLKPLPQMNELEPLLFRWRQKVPVLVSSGPVARAEVAEKNGHVILRLSLSQPIKDVFVEGNPLHYFQAPLWRDNGTLAALTVAGAKSVADVKRQPLRLTIDVDGSGLEQMVTVV
jgi:DsbC/DsbD-like thiol-disulfide interchange protein